MSNIDFALFHTNSYPRPAGIADSTIFIARVVFVCVCFGAFKYQNLLAKFASYE